MDSVNHRKARALPAWDPWRVIGATSASVRSVLLRRGRPSWSSGASAAAAGAATFLGFAGFDLWPLAFVALVPLFLALDDARLGAARAAGLGWICGVVAHAGGTYWLAGTLARFGGHPPAIGVALALLVWSWEGAQYAVFAWLVWRATRTFRAWWAVPWAWAAVETAFPLALPSQLAASLHPVPALTQLVSLGGATLASILIVQVNLAVFLALRRGRGERRSATIAIAMSLVAMGVAMTWGRARLLRVDAAMADAPDLRVGVVQPNVSPEDKRAGAQTILGRNVELTRTLTRRGPLDLVVWPETAWPGALDPEADQVPAIADVVRRKGALLPARTPPVLFGSLTLQTRGEHAGLYNSAVLAGPHGEVLARYDKRRLVPFAEAMPFVDHLPVLRTLAPDAAQFREGLPGGPLVVSGTTASVLICYEDVLPHFVRDRVRAEHPGLLVNLTNDAWFGDTTAPRIHLALARLRAIESGRALVRATNSGISAVIDPAGRVIAAVPSFGPHAFATHVPLAALDTPFTRFGNWPGWLGVLTCAGLVLGAMGRRHANVPGPER